MCRSRCKRNRKGRGGAADLTLRRTDATVAEAVSRTSDELYAEACRVIPGGVNSPVRSWSAVGGKPLFIARARGAEVVDADGHAYLDFVGSWGPLLLGHAHPAVIAAIAERARHGTSFGAPTVGEVQLARLLVEALPSLEQVRLVSSGTEATMSALRLARATTGRDLIVKFAGCYHGHVDALLVRAGSGGGLPLAAFAGRRDLMERLAPTGPVYQAGTLSGNPLSVAAGLETLTKVREMRGAYERLEELGALAERGLAEATQAAGVAACVNRVGSMLTLFLGVEGVSDYDGARRADTSGFGRFFRGMLDEGIYLPPSQFEAMFVSLAHTESDIERLAHAARKVLVAC